MGEGGSHTHIIRIKTTRPSFTLRGTTEVQTVKERGPRPDRVFTLNLRDVVSAAECVYTQRFQRPLQHDETHRWEIAPMSFFFFFKNTDSLVSLMNKGSRNKASSPGPTLIHPVNAAIHSRCICCNFISN